MATLPGLRVAVGLDSAVFVAESRRINASVDRMGRNVAQQNAQMQRGFSAVAGAAKGLAASLGAMVTVAGAVRLGSLAKDALDAAGNLGEMAIAAGVTTSELQALQVAGVQVGVSSEEMVRALAQFGVRVGEARQGTGELVDTLERYRIVTANSSGQVRSSIDILGDLADAVQRAGSEQERLSIVADAFGSRVGPRLLPLLTEGADGFRQWAEQAEAAGLIMDEEFIAAADRASDGIATLQFAVAKGFEIGVVEEFATAVNVSADAIERARQVGEAFGRTVGNSLEIATDAMESLQPFFETTRREIEALAQLLERFFSVVGLPFDLAARAAEDASRATGPLRVDIREALGRPEQTPGATLTGPTIGPAPMSRFDAQSFGLGIASVHVGGAADFAGQLDTLRQMSQAQAELNAQLALAPPAVEQVSIAYDLAHESAQLFASTAASGITDAVFQAKSFGDALEGIAVSFSKAIVEALIFKAIMASINAVTAGAGGAGGGAGGFGALIAGFLPGPGGTGAAGRASGGPVSPGMVYQVGERGPEFFVPNVSGQIVPSGGGQGMAPTINIIDQRGKGAPPVETSVDFRGVVTATIRAEVGSMARDGTLGMMTGNRRKGIARG